MAGKTVMDVRHAKESPNVMVVTAGASAIAALLASRGLQLEVVLDEVRQPARGGQ
jgi:hypothetical protein